MRTPTPKARAARTTKAKSIAAAVPPLPVLTNHPLSLESFIGLHASYWRNDALKEGKVVDICDGVFVILDDDNGQQHHAEPKNVRFAASTLLNLPTTLIGMKVHFTDDPKFSGRIEEVVGDGAGSLIVREDGTGKTHASLASSTVVSIEDLLQWFTSSHAPSREAQPFHHPHNEKSAETRAKLRPGMLVYDDLADCSGMVIWQAPDLVVYELVDGTRQGQCPQHIFAATAGGFVDQMVPAFGLLQPADTMGGNPLYRASRWALDLQSALDELAVRPDLDADLSGHVRSAEELVMAAADVLGDMAKLFTPADYAIRHVERPAAKLATRLFGIEGALKKLEHGGIPQETLGVIAMQVRAAANALDTAVLAEQDKRTAKAPRATSAAA